MLSRDGIAGLVCLAIGIALLLQTRGMPPAGLVPIGPAFYPRLVLALLAICSVILIGIDVFAAWRRRAAAAAGAPAAIAIADTRPNYALVLLTFVLFGAYIGLLPGLGFRIATFLFVVALQAALEWPRSWKRWLLVIAVAAATALLCHLVFESYLSVLLPRGGWSGM